jgi:hypothetical protein
VRTEPSARHCARNAWHGACKHASQHRTPGRHAATPHTQGSPAPRKRRRVFSRPLPTLVFTCFLLRAASFLSLSHMDAGSNPHSPASHGSPCRFPAFERSVAQVFRGMRDTLVPRHLLRHIGPILRAMNCISQLPRRTAAPQRLHHRHSPVGKQRSPTNASRRCPRRLFFHIYSGSSQLALRVCRGQRMNTMFTHIALPASRPPPARSHV